MTPDQVVALVDQYKYLILLPFTVFEGPIATVIGGFLASIGVLNFFGVFAISLLGDFLGDSMWWAIGRSSRGRFLSRILHRMGMSKDRFLRVESHFRNNGAKTLFIGKFIYGLETVTLAAAGAAKVPYWRFTFYTVLPSIPKSFFFTVIGYYFGHAYLTISRYLDNAALLIGIVVPILIALFIVYRFGLKKLAARKVVNSNDEENTNRN